MDQTQSAAEYDYDVAVSFAGEDREYVEEFVEKVKDKGYRIFYDQDLMADLWGSNLIDFLQAVYARRARFAVLFISRHYVEKRWPQHERQSAQDRALQESSPYILPVRLDDTQLPGLHSTIGYLDARHVSLDGIVDALGKKLGASEESRPPTFDGKVPRTSESLATVLGERPAGWEYLLYAGTLKQNIKELESKYRDHLLEYAPMNGVHLRGDDALAYVQNGYAALLHIADSFGRVLSGPAQEAAFGSPGKPGDPERILHLANRYLSVYEELLDWAADRRATTIHDDDLKEAASLQAHLVDQPVDAMRAFVSDFTHEVDSMHAKLIAGNDVDITMVVPYETDDDLLEQIRRAIKRYTDRN